MIGIPAIMTSVRPNSQYNVAAADSLPVKVAAHQRRKMFARFLADTGAARRPHSSLDGATPDQAYFRSLTLRLPA
jgi:hypothetical protein